MAELTLTEQPAGAVATAQAAQGTPDESQPPAAAAALPEPAEPPDLDRLGDQIAELSARIDAATYELLCHLHQFNQQHGWEGFRSCAHWLNWRTGLDLGAAREKLRVAAALAELPHISAAMACGRLSYSKVRALSRVAASPATEARLLAVACGATAAQVERLVRGWRQADHAAQADGEQLRLASRMLSTQVDDNGMLVLRARLTPEWARCCCAPGRRRWSRCRRRPRTATSPRLRSGVPMRWGWWPRVRWPAGSIRATPATASR